MEWVETAGRTLDEAKDAALDQLGVDESDAEFVIVSEPKVGLFGRTRGEARVRARLRPTQPRPKRGRDRRTGGSRHRSSPGTGGVGTGENSRVVADDRSGASSRGGAGAEPETSPGALDSSGAGRPRRRGSAGGGTPAADERGQSRQEGDVVTAARPTSGDGMGASTNDQTGESDARADASDGRAIGVQPERRVTGGNDDEDKDKETPVVEMSLQEQGEAARRFVTELVQTLGLEASVETQPTDEETVAVTVEGDGVGTLIGPGGTTLSALQELTRTYVQKLTGGQSERILVDVAGYRSRRIAALQRFTQGVATEVLTSGEARALEAMSAADRKVVHDAINEIDGVSTRSEGEDPRRYVVIVPSPAGS